MLNVGSFYLIIMLNSHVSLRICAQNIERNVFYCLRRNFCNTFIKPDALAYCKILGSQWTSCMTGSSGMPVIRPSRNSGGKSYGTLHAFCTSNYSWTLDYLRKATCPIAHQGVTSLLQASSKNVFVSKRSMAGHSKWQNIRHTKAQKDREKAMIFQKYCFMIRRAILENGSPDPKLNSKLASVIEQARAHNMPSSTIETTIKRATNAKVKSGIIELMGPNKSFFVVEVESDNMNRTVYDIKQLRKKYGIHAVEEGRTKHLFEQKAIIRAREYNSGEKLDKDKALELGIEAEAEEVFEDSDVNENTVFNFVASAEDFGRVKKALEGANVKVEEASVDYVPTQSVELGDSEMKLVEEFLGSLQGLQDVVRVFDNVRA